MPAGGARAYAPSFFQGYLLAALREEAWPDATLLVVLADSGSAGRFAADLRAFSPGVRVELLPARGALPGSDQGPSARKAGQRHAALSLLAAGSPGIVVAGTAALMERATDARLPEPLALAPEGGPGFEAAVRGLAALGYERVEQVEDRGQFAVRGGIIDCFPATGEQPLRAEFWGDEIDSLRSFSPYTQRSLRDEAGVVIYAAAWTGGDGLPEGPALLEGPAAAAPLCLVDPEAVAAAAAGLLEDALDVSTEEETAASLLSAREFEAALDGRPSLVLESLPTGQEHSFRATSFRFTSRRLGEAASQLERLAAGGQRIFIFFSTEGAARRVAHNLAGRVELLATDSPAPEKPGTYLLVGPAPAGFVSGEAGLTVIPERSLIRQSRAARSQQGLLAGQAIMSFRDLVPGDYIVHEDHGIGIFEAVETKTVAGVTRDYLHLGFKGEDALFVPHEQIARVSRYIGAGAGSPPLNKLGGRAWAQARARARQAAREMAGELLQLYAVRQNLPGHRFAPDDEWQAELEAAFPYDETPDQAAAIEDVKDDMESPHPMDRLICGDVGYGKTEVALRAAFKAAAQQKQVLMLVPTTILALQHYQTFSSRFEPFPVGVEMISRFRTPAEARRIAADFRDGNIDMLIGTHRLLSHDITPRDLGLVIVDEEQRFGVAQKEMLRQLKLKVDVLSLSATPIPRTLQMSLAGIRDISIMESPPPGRYPIRTYVGEYDEDVVRQAIIREVERGGQVFFLHNRVETIAEKAAELKALAPDLDFLVAHGQMPERQLEEVMARFLEREASVLVCTSIIESGLDIPTANTLIVDQADMLGLAQLYQIRGRIGRSDVVAHAYLLYQPHTELTDEARARLSTLSDYSELGSGFRIAMRDLEIRGAGNLLGDEQSGHVAAVGFEMYCDLLRHAVAELRDRPIRLPSLARVEIGCDAYIPGDYVPFEAARIDIHHRIAAATDEQALGDMAAELKDRFGELPEPVGNLLALQEARLKGGLLGAGAVVLSRGRLELKELGLDSRQRESLEKSGLEHAAFPARRSLVVWLDEAEAGPAVVNETLSVIIDSLLTPTEKI
ncbi:MAG: transcription-repair coupling factor [Gaiellales bacterium]|nr:MAG: transcription-repair coupling factor [Gaiellales bacterium]